MYGCNISNTRKSVSSGYPNPEKWVEKTRRSRVSLTDFEVFGDLMKHSFEIIIKDRQNIPFGMKENVQDLHVLTVSMYVSHTSLEYQRSSDRLQKTRIKTGTYTTEIHTAQ